MALDRINLLRKVAHRLQAGELGADGVMVGEGFARYLGEAARGVSLDAALGVEGFPWWIIERDAALREFVDLFLKGEPSVRTKASTLTTALRRYEAGHWKSGDRRLMHLPDSFTGTPRECLFRVCRASNNGESLSERQIRRIISI